MFGDLAFEYSEQFYHPGGNFCIYDNRGCLWFYCCKLKRRFCLDVG